MKPDGNHRLISGASPAAVTIGRFRRFLRESFSAADVREAGVNFGRVATAAIHACTSDSLFCLMLVDIVAVYMVWSEEPMGTDFVVTSFSWYGIPRNFFTVTLSPLSRKKLSVVQPPTSDNNTNTNNSFFILYRLSLSDPRL